MTKSWTYGSDASCEILVDSPSVSRRHCLLSFDGLLYALEDLASTNGTLVNGRPIEGRVFLVEGDAVTLGPSVRLPWPSDAPPPPVVVIRLGRDPDNDFVVDSPVVSGRHALLAKEGDGGSIWIVDLGSANGTAIGAPDRKVKRSALNETDTIYLGSHPLSLAAILASHSASRASEIRFRADEMRIGRDPANDRVIDFPQVSGRHARLVRSGDGVEIEDLGSANGTYVNGRRVSARQAVTTGDAIGLGSLTFRLAIEQSPVPTATPRPDHEETSATTLPVVAEAIPAIRKNEPTPVPGFAMDRAWAIAALAIQPVVAAFGLLLLARGGVEGSAPAASPRGLAVLLGGASLAAVWFGLASAGVTSWLIARRPETERGGAVAFATRLGGIGAAGLVQCLVAWAILAIGGGLWAPVLPALALLVLATWVGGGLGCLICRLAPRPEASYALLPIVLVAMGIAGAGPRWLADWTPSRWAFEGLLLLEAREQGSNRAAEAEPAPDLAEPFFPAGTERSGPKAAALALGFMIAGLVATLAFIEEARRPTPTASAIPSGGASG